MWISVIIISSVYFSYFTSRGYNTEPIAVKNKSAKLPHLTNEGRRWCSSIYASGDGLSWGLSSCAFRPGFPMLAYEFWQFVLPQMNKPFPCAARMNSCIQLQSSPQDYGVFSLFPALVCWASLCNFVIASVFGNIETSGWDDHADCIVFKGYIQYENIELIWLWVQESFLIVLT